MGTQKCLQGCIAFGHILPVILFPSLLGSMILCYTQCPIKLRSGPGQIFKSAANISRISSGLLCNFSLNLFEVFVQFFGSPFKNYLENFTKIPPKCFNANTSLKSVSTSKSRVTYDLDTNRVAYDLDTDRVTYDFDTDRVTYDLDTDRVTYDLDTDTTMHKIIGVVGSPSTSLRLYLPPFRNLVFHCS